jgi:hypothetical protein
MGRDAIDQVRSEAVVAERALAAHVLAVRTETLARR